ncbi:transposase-like protein, IS1167 [Streptococcus pneumoniae]|nr:transposase-like protein, IS1167 [Streptococcus pneumoniae]
MPFNYHYYNAKLEATNNLIKPIKRNAFGFRNFENFKKRIFIALNIKKERTKFVLSRSLADFNPLQLTKSRNCLITSISL